MAIEGDLSSLNITSVLQLISRERLTGVLKIKKGTEVADVGFIDGDITGAFFELMPLATWPTRIHGSRGNRSLWRGVSSVSRLAWAFPYIRGCAGRKQGRCPQFS